MKSFCYACKGIATALHSEMNMRIHIVAAILVVTAGFFFELSSIEWGVVIICIVLVISFELINTAIEELCNLVQPEHHPIVKKIKDIAAAAVLIAAVGSLVIAFIIFLPKLISLIGI
ncbi:MAG: diacylglycerol kinase family protein [Lacibacter sp.]|nr:diacylglycerol kinase family protein [Lacibacter sp.]